MIGFEIEVKGLDEVLAALENLAGGGLERAVQRAVGGPGGSENATKWVHLMQQAAETTLRAHASPAMQGHVAGFVQAVTHQYVSTPPGALISLTVPGSLIAQAMALSESLHTRSYPTPAGPVQRVRQQPVDASAEQQVILDNVRDIVRDWVTHEKRYDLRDAELDFDPDAVTNRVLAIMGLGGRESWTRLREAPELRDAGERLAAVIERWMAGVMADGGQITIEGTGLAGDPKVTLPSADAMSSSLNMSPELVAWWLKLVGLAWVKWADQEVVAIVNAEIRRAMTPGQGALDL